MSEFVKIGLLDSGQETLTSTTKTYKTYKTQRQRFYRRLAEADDEELHEILEEDPRKSIRELALELAVSHTVRSV